METTEVELDVELLDIRLRLEAALDSLHLEDCGYPAQAVIRSAVLQLTDLIMLTGARSDENRGSEATAESPDAVN